MRPSYFYICCGLWSMFTFIKCQSVIETSDDGSSGKLSFSTPNLNDEESHSPWIPNALKCDSCSAVAYQLYNKFKVFNAKHKSLKYNLPEYEILDIFEEVCSNSDTWQAYGIKEVKKVKRLSGPGLEMEDVPGITAGGGQWPGRLRDLCEQFMGEIGEVEVYNIYKASPKNKKKITEFLCNGTGFQSSCGSSEKDEL